MNHGSLIVSEFDTGVKIIESCWDQYIRIWGFHDGLLFAKINIKEHLHGICLWIDNDLFVGCGKSIKLINLENGEIKRELTNYYNEDVLTLKSFKHPKYGNCLIIHNILKGQIILFIINNNILNEEKI